MNTNLTKIVEKMPTTELNNTYILTDRLLTTIGRGCEQTNQRRFSCDIYVELLLLKSTINKELIWRERKEF